MTWSMTLSADQRMEVLYLKQIARYGQDAVERPIDRTSVESLSMEEFNLLKEAEFLEEETWRKEHGWISLTRRTGKS
jgi:hypothetical protein